MKYLQQTSFESHISFLEHLRELRGNNLKVNSQSKVIIYKALLSFKSIPAARFEPAEPW